MLGILLVVADCYNRLRTGFGEASLGGCMCPDRQIRSIYSELGGCQPGVQHQRDYRLHRKADRDLRPGYNYSGR